MGILVALGFILWGDFLLLKWREKFFRAIISILITLYVILWFSFLLLKEVNFLCFESGPASLVVFLPIISWGTIGTEDGAQLKRPNEKEGAAGLLIPPSIQFLHFLVGTIAMAGIFIFTFRYFEKFPPFSLLALLLPILSYVLLAITLFSPKGKRAGYIPFLFHLASTFYAYTLLFYSGMPFAERRIWTVHPYLVLSTIGMVVNLVFVPPIIWVLQGKEVTGRDLHHYLARLKLIRPLGE